MRFRSFLPAAGVCAALAAAVPGQAQTVVLVRHAEKAAQPAGDPPLTEAGQARAQALAASLADAKVSLILTSPLLRTRQTAAPLAAAAGVEAQTVDLAADIAAHVAATAAKVRAAPAEATVVVVGHSNTVPDLARALGYAEARAIPDCRYDDLLILRLDGPRTTAVNGRYGAAAAC